MQVPADIIVLATSEKEGLGYVSTATLDGEQTLKPKQAVGELQDTFEKKGVDGLLRFECDIECQPPDKSIHHFTGKLSFVDEHGSEVKYPLSMKQMLLRVSVRIIKNFQGSMVMNVDFIVGIVGYTGKETKIMLN